MQAPHFVQVNKRQTQTHIGFKIFMKLHSVFYDPFFYKTFYNISLQKRLNENGIRWRGFTSLWDRHLKFFSKCWISKWETTVVVIFLFVRFQRILDPAFAKKTQLSISKTGESPPKSTLVFFIWYPLLAKFGGKSKI